MEEKIRNAMKIFMQNKFFKEYYENAPTDACKKYIEYEFVYSIYLEPENIKELNEKLEEEFGLEDWRHLYRYSGINPFRGKCRRKIDAILKEQEGK